ncbi:hypothetical protein [uncultured Acetatifactor sp.]|jgi:hypothetical protein|uniref:hypothetical protein n=1 Tax=uncultured Acetatifactor sp. TaxID=1671927 RepID=UPI0026046374|nr:hypothetical protein [uncultured Acetatifactor sp.]
MNMVTSMTFLTTAEGKRISITFSEVDDDGRLIRENERIPRIVVDKNALMHIAELEDFALKIVDKQQSERN